VSGLLSTYAGYSLALVLSPPVRNNTKKTTISDSLLFYVSKTYTFFLFFYSSFEQISYCLANYAGFNSSQVWLGTLIITGIGNYFLLSALMSDKKKVDPKDFL
tara:strand:+ start:726 stop:1034 length:309 start_codon:yes stop_codon:yes gene_type:complete